jgi:hypothetical protein
MIEILLFSWGLMAICVAIHALGVMTFLRRFDRSLVLDDPRFWRQTLLLIRVAAWLILLHVLEIAVWASFYALNHAMPDWHSALYFSSVTYTTTGYGDLVLPEGWRLAGGIEALTGILMCGLSTGFFFSVLTRLHRSHKAATPAG